MNQYALPDDRGHFGPYGGMFVAETLMQPLTELREAYERYRDDPDFQAEFMDDLRLYVGRPSPLYPAQRLTETWGGARIYLKREDLNHTGAHKVNNTIGQALLAKRMGKNPHYCRDRRRSAWRGFGYCGSTLGYGVRGLHGFGRYCSPGDQCLSHEIAGCQSGTGGVWLQRR